MSSASSSPMIFFSSSTASAILTGRATGSETRAKQALDGWVEALLGEPVLRGGVAYAEEVGAAISPARVSKRRNPDLHAFLHEHLPAWLDALTAREA